MTLDLTPAERPLWLAHRLEPDSTATTMALALHLSGPLDPDRLSASFDAVCQESDALRTRYHAVDAVEARVEIVATPLAPLTRVDLTEHPDVQAWIDERAAQAFDPADCCYDVTLAHLGPERWLLLVIKHHLITDGGSFAAFTQRLAEHYTSQVGHPAVHYRTLPLPSPRPRTTAFFEALEDAVADQPASLTWYGRRHQPGGPSTRRRAPVSETSWSTIDAAVVDPAFRTLSPALTRQSLLLAAFACWVAEATQESRLLIGLPVPHRSTPDERRVIGLRMERAPLLLDIAPDDTFLIVFRRVRDATMNLLRHARPGCTSPALQRAIQVDFNFTPHRFAPFAGLDQRVDWIHPGRSEPRMAVRVQVHDFDGRGPRVLMDLADDTFDAPDRAIRRFVDVLDAGLTEPDAPLHTRLALSDRWATARAWSGLDRLPDEDPYHLAQRICDQARRHPDTLAVQHADTSCTYEALVRRATGLAGALQAAGVRHGDRVGVCHRRGVELVVGLVAIHLTGAAYVPVDPGYPPERIATVFADCGVAVVLADASCPVLPSGTTPIPTTATGPFTPVPVDPTDLAYVLFTSGSTGRPKGVEIEHRNVAALVRWSDERFGEALDGVLGATSVCFDVSVFEMFVPLCTGRRLILAADLLQAPGIPQIGDVTFVSAVPSAMRALLAVDRHPFPAAQAVLLAGEFADEALVDDLYDVGFDAVHDIYGATEATVHSIGGRRVRGAAATIGRAMPGELIYILDPTGRPVTAGEVGEIHLGGHGIARGYWGRPDLTEARFIRAPAESGTDRLYRTGDLGCFLADGEAVYRGRIDDQLKVRGFRIEPGEVAATARLLPACTAVWVGGVEGPMGVALGAACVGCTAEALREHLAEALPPYMVPTLLVQLEHLPLTANEKVDVPLLRSGSLFDTDHERAPSHGMLAEVCALVERVLGRSVDPTESFLAAGGDSIMALHVSAHAQKRGLVLTPADLIASGSLGELAHTVESNADEARHAPFHGPVPEGPIWAHAHGATRFDQSIVVQLDTTPTPEHLHRALDALLAHHDLLRMCWTPAPHVPPEAVSWPLKLVELDHPMDDERRVSWPDDAPRVHAALRPDGRLTLTAHHLLVDAVSWSVLLDDLDSALRGDPLPPRTTSYAAWVEDVGRLPPVDDHWQAALAQPAVALPAPPTPTTVADLTHVRTEHRVPERLREATRDVLLATLGRLLVEQYGGPVWVDVEGHGRLDAGPNVVRTVGWFTSMFPLRLTETDDHATVAKTFQGLPYQGVGYGLGVARGAFPSAGAAVLFQFFGRSLADDRIVGPLQLDRSPDHPLRHALDVVVTLQGATVVIDWNLDPRVSGLPALPTRFGAKLASLTSHDDFGLSQQTLGKLAGLLGGR